MTVNKEMRCDVDGNVIEILDYWCPATRGDHFRTMDRVVSPWEVVRERCERCGASITVHGHRWVTATFVIREEECIEDLLG